MNLPISIKFSDSFYDEEVKCGYLITAKQKRIWAVELDLLSELVRVCKKHNINFSLFAGTMLGAVRHNGFIPWDDDLDVCLDRENFTKLCRVAEKEFRAPYFFQTSLSDEAFFCPYARLRNSKTTGVITGQEAACYNGGIFIDVFVVDGVASNLIAYRVHRLLMAFEKKIIQECITREIVRYSFCSRLLRFAAPVFRMFGRRFWIKLYDMTSAIFSNAKMLGLLSHSDIFASRYRISREEIGKIHQVNFNGVKAPVSTDAQAVLERIYGDYLTMPPVEERGKWHKGEITFNPDISYSEFLRKANND